MSAVGQTGSRTPSVVYDPDFFVLHFAENNTKKFMHVVQEVQKRHNSMLHVYFIP
jgi:hypothetical protein